MENKRNEIRAELSILRACSLQIKLENKRDTKVDLSKKKLALENLRKISKQGALNILKLVFAIFYQIFIFHHMIAL